MQGPNGWQILKDFIRDHIDHQPGMVERFCKDGSQCAEASCRITDMEDAYKAFGAKSSTVKGGFTDAFETDALSSVKWDDEYLSVYLSEHYPKSNPPKPPTLLKKHLGNEFNTKKLFTSMTSRGTTPVTRHQRCSSGFSGRNAKAASSLYRGPFAFVPYVYRQQQTNSRAMLSVYSSINVFNLTGHRKTSPNALHTSRMLDHQVNPILLSPVNTSGISPVLRLATNQSKYLSAPSVGSPNAQFTRLGAPYENDVSPMVRGSQAHRRDESCSSSTTSRGERKGPIIAKTPEDI
ncbi:hypothetical protein MMC07_003015 [Pseudocyphellaria aurata]|nr:hypothetical protein [Pseudocyphellaria aurata]